MDGRWSWIVALGLAGGLTGCTSLASRQPNGAPTGPASPPLAKTPAAPQQVAAAPPRSGKLKPSTHIAMGALSEQLADDTARPASEREQFRAQARQSYQKALEIDPKYGPGYVALAMSYQATDERDYALAMYQKALDVAPGDAAIWAELGNFYARTKEWDPAVDCLSQAARLAPENKTYLKRLGFTLARAGRMDEGYLILVKCMPEAEARFNVARMYQHLKQPEACRRQLEFALKANPEYEPAQEMLATLTGAADSAVRPAAYNETAATIKPASYAEPVVAAKTSAPAPARSVATAAPPARLPPVILGSREAPLAPLKVGIDGIVD